MRSRISEPQFVAFCLGYPQLSFECLPTHLRWDDFAPCTTVRAAEDLKDRITEEEIRFVEKTAGIQRNSNGMKLKISGISTKAWSFL